MVSPTLIVALPQKWQAACSTKNRELEGELLKTGSPTTIASSQVLLAVSNAVGNLNFFFSDEHVGVFFCIWKYL